MPAIKYVIHSSDFSFGLERARISGLVVFSTYIKNFLILLGIPLLSYISFAFSLATKKKKWIILFVFLFMLSCLIKTYNFEKAPIVYYFFVLLIIYIYYRGGISKKITATFMGAGAVLLVFFYKASGSGKLLSSMYEGIMGRTFFSQFGTLAQHMELFSRSFDFLYGRSFSPKILELIGQDPEMSLRSGKLVMGYYGWEHVYNGTANVANTFFIGEAFANWGTLGICFAVLWVAIIVALLFMAMIKLKKTPITIAYFAFMTVSVVTMSQGGFVDFIYNPVLVVTTIGFAALYYISKKSKH